MKTIREKLTGEIERCVNLLEAYKEIGPAGVFGFSHIDEAVESGRRALDSGNEAVMQHALVTLLEKE